MAEDSDDQPAQNRNRVSRFAAKDFLTGGADVTPPTLKQTHHLVAPNASTRPPVASFPALGVVAESTLISEAVRKPKWPDGLNDWEASERLRGIMSNVANGQRNVADDRQYRPLRSIFMRDTALSVVAPRLLAIHTSLDALDTYLKTRPRPERLAEVMNDWQALFDYFDDVEHQNLAIISDASKWTGQKTNAQLARTVRVRSATALKAVQSLVDEHEARHHNGGPIDPLEDEALKELKDFRDALNDLIVALEADQPFEKRLEVVQSIGGRAQARLAEHLATDSAAFLALGSMITYSAVVAACAWAIGLDAITAYGSTAAGYVAIKTADVLKTK